LFDFSNLAFEERQRSNGVRQIERLGLLICAIKRERFLIAAFGQFHSARVPMDVSHMSHGMRELERVAFSAADGNGLFIKQQGHIAVSRVSFDLAQPFERYYQFAASSGLATERNSRSQTDACITRSILTARPPGLIYKGVKRF
jgi:hypothetical protein